MQKAEQGRVSPADMLAGVLLVAVPVLAMMVWSMLAKGVWYDEMWSKWMVSSEGRLADAVTLRWFQDVHPPLFYGLNRLADAVVGPGVTAHRLLNLIPLALLIGVAAHVAYVRPAMRMALVIAGLLFLTNHDIIYFGEYRSYATIMCMAGTLLLLLSETLQRGRDLLWRQDRLLLVMLALASIAALNLHYISTLICGVTLGVFTLDRMRLRHWRWARALIIIAIVAMLPVLASLWAQRQFLASVTTSFWITTDSFMAFTAMAGRFVYASGVNFAIVVGLALAGVAWLRTAGGGARLGATGHFVLLTALSAALACTMLMLANAYKPLIVPRYLVALTPIAILPLSMLVADALATRRWLFGLFLVNALAAGLWFTWSIRTRPAWDEGARVVAAATKACPQTVVYSMWRMHGLPKSPFADIPGEQAFIAWSMADLGRRYGFSPQMVKPASPGAQLARSKAGCPTILYIEHAAALDGPATARAAGLAAESTSPAAINTVHTRTGTIITLSPAA